MSYECYVLCFCHSIEDAKSKVRNTHNSSLITLNFFINRIFLE